MGTDLAYLTAIVDCSDDAIIGARLDGIIEIWNPGAERLYGYTAAETIGRGVALIESAEHQGEIAGILARVARGEIIRNYCTRRRRKDGTLVDVSITVSPVRDAEHRVVGASAMALDVARQAALENALQLSEERYRSLALASAQIVWTKNEHGEAADDWPTWRAFTGQTQAEIAGRGWLDAIDPGDRESLLRVWEHAVEHRIVYETEYRIRRHDGEFRDMAVRGVPVFDQAGHIREWVGSCLDITDRKRAEEEARQSQRELELKTLFATIFLTLSEHEIFAAVLDAILCHMESEQGVFGYIDEEGALVFPIWTWGERPVAGETIRLPRAQWNGPWGRALVEKRPIYTSGRDRSMVAPILFQKEVIGLFAVAGKTIDYTEQDKQTLERLARDIAPVLKSRLERDSEERARQRAEDEAQTINAELEERVEERTAQLQAANQELEAFAYSVSHDLRAPLRAIHGFSRILMDEYAPQLDPTAQHYLEVVRANALQMGELIDDLLTFARLSRQPLEKQTVTPAALVDLALAELRPETPPQAEVVLGDLPPCRGDRTLLKQVFVNLLSNAIKYSSKRAVPRIEIGALAPENGSGPTYYVRDNGVGFDMRYIHKLFGVFQRLHRAEEYQGTGIGLATVQRIVHRHGGRVWAESELDHGATFYFTLEADR